MIYGKKPVDILKIQKYGLLAVKIGQVHATRLDFLPIEKCEELSKLYRSTIPISSEDVLSHVDMSLFSEFEETPLASASVGQVHKARLKNGDEVVVKVIKARFKKDFIAQVRAVKILFKIAIFFYPKLSKVFDPIGILEHIEEYTLRELDLLNEIEGHNTLKNIYDENKHNFDLSKLKFCRIYEDISGSDLMVSEFVSGKTIDELLENGEMDYSDLLTLFKVHGFFLFNIGTFHGDIHPGNIILNGGNFYFIDTGAIGYATSKLSHGLLNFFDHLSNFDYPNCAKALNQMSEVYLDGEKFLKFEKEFIDLYKDFTNSTVSDVSLTKKMMQTIKLGVLNGMRFEKGMFPIIKSLMFLDGMVLKCNPDARLLPDMRQFIDEFNINSK